MNIEAKKDGKGNIIISENSFEMLLACLDNQKFVGGSPQNVDSLPIGIENYWKGHQETQKLIEDYNRQCRKILYQKYVFDTTHNGLSLYKKYQYQYENIIWDNNDVALVYELFKDTRIIYNKANRIERKDDDYIENGWLPMKAKSRPWLIERPLNYDYEYLTISEDGFNNRPWKKEEIEKISKLFNKKIILQYERNKI